MNISNDDRLSVGASAIAALSHDIRTPLNAVIGYSSLLKQAAEDPEKVKEYACKIQLSGNVLLGIINDILEIHRIKTGKCPLKNEPFNLIGVIEEVEAAVRPQVRKRHQELVIYFDPYGYSDNFIGDRGKLRRILLNLVSNAVKYTQDGGNIELQVTTKENGEMIFIIRDNGCGMDEEFLKTIFEPFARAETAGGDIEHGAGLGMPITKEIVELMGGTIAIDSAPGQGTAVTVCLTMPQTERQEQRLRASRRPGKRPLEGMRFLVAEDNELNREIISEMLSVKGAESVIAANGREAVELFGKNGERRFDAVLMDIRMPVMNGYEAAEQIKAIARERGEEIYIAALTADAFDSDVRKALCTGMDAHIAKPVDMDAFVDLMLPLKNKRPASQDAG